MSEQLQTPGRIITFYSYKGGTGRSMAMANVAWVLALSGAKVLAIDWDLEAPGLHRYFRPFLDDPDLTESEGLIDFATHVVEGASEQVVEGASEQNEEPADPDWYKPLSNLLPYAKELNYSFPDGGTLDFIPAGRQNSAYAIRVNSFNWKQFYEKLNGSRVLEEASAILRDEYDFVLIDSRTGVSDTAGICTVQMPDDLVVCFTLNLQSVIGASSAAASVAEQRMQRSRAIRVFPIPMRVEPAEKLKTINMKAYAKPRFLPLLPGEMTEDDKDRYWTESDVNYIPFYAFEENLAYFRDELNSPGSVLSAMKLIAQRLAGAPLPDLPKVHPDLLATIIAAYDAFSGPSGLPAAAPKQQTPVYLSANDDPGVEALRQTLEGLGFDVLTRERFERSRGVMVLFAVGPTAFTPSQMTDFWTAARLGAAPIYTVMLPGVVPETLPRLLLPFAVIDLRAGQEFVLPAPTEKDELQRLPIDPYPGLKPFTVTDEPVFFARAAVIERLVDAVNRSNFVAVVGPPYSGKTSLIQAGLIPKLNRMQLDQGWEIRFGLPTSARSTGRTLVVVDSRALAAGPEVSIPDNMCILAEAETPEQLVFCEHKLRLSAARIEVTPLSELEVTQAITEPAARAGLRIAAALADRVVADIKGQKDQLSLLQFMMSEIYAASPRGVLTLAKYESLGGIEMVERRCEMISDAGELDWLSRLVSLSEDGSIALQLVPEGSIPERNRSVVDAFVNAGILVRDNASLRFANRIFVDRWTRLQNWLKENREYVLWRQRLVQNMIAWQTNPLPFRLLSGEPLAEAKQRVGAGREQLNNRELSYIDASEKYVRLVPTQQYPTGLSWIKSYLAIPLFLLLLASLAFWYFRPSPSITVLLSQTSDPSFDKVSSALKQKGFIVGVDSGQPQPPSNTLWYSPDVSQDQLSPVSQILQSAGVNPISEKSSSVANHTISIGSFVPGPGPNENKGQVDAWGVLIATDETLSAPARGGPSALYEVQLAAGAGYKQISIYHTNDGYSTVINSADEQSAKADLQKITKIPRPPYWAKATPFRLSKDCPDANEIGGLAVPPLGGVNGTSIQTTVNECNGRGPMPAKQFSVEYSDQVARMFRGAVDKGTHVFVPNTPFTWREALKGRWIGWYTLLAPASVGGCDGYSFVKIPVTEGTQIFISNQDSGCNKPFLSYRHLKGTWSVWTLIGEQLPYSGDPLKTQSDLARAKRIP